MTKDVPRDLMRVDEFSDQRRHAENDYAYLAIRSAG